MLPFPVFSTIGLPVRNWEMSVMEFLLIEGCLVHFANDELTRAQTNVKYQNRAYRLHIQ